jgi:membrane protein implicated in regulation of membrane protease activity
MPEPIKPDPNNQPSWRKPVGMFLILGLIAIWAVVILALSPIIGALAWPLQAIFYAIAGVVWIMPLRPLLRWMELGTFR